MKSAQNLLSNGLRVQLSLLGRLQQSIEIIRGTLTNSNSVVVKVVVTPSTGSNQANRQERHISSTNNDNW